MCEETGKHIANARFNLSIVTAGFPLSLRKVRDRGCCNMDCAKATVVAAKENRKGSRKTLVSKRVRIAWLFFMAQVDKRKLCGRSVGACMSFSDVNMT